MINAALSSHDTASLYVGQQLGTSYSMMMTTRPVLDAVALGDDRHQADLDVWVGVAEQGGDVVGLPQRQGAAARRDA